MSAEHGEASLPAPYRHRRARRSDLADWLRITEAVDLAETGEVDADEALVLEDWHRPRFVLERDAFIVEDADGAAVAYGYGWEAAAGERVIADNYVLPDLAAVLEEPVLDLALAEADRIAAAAAATRVQVPNSAANTRRASWIAARGFVPVRTFRRMRLDLTLPPVQPPPVEGVTVREYDERDAPDVHRVKDLGFAEHWGSVATSYEEFRETFVDVPGHDPSLWSVAELDGEIVGMLMGSDVVGRGFVRTVAVLPEHRGRGIGEALLLRSFDVFRDRGWTAVELIVDAENTTGATRLYERVGMHVAHGMDMWERQTSAAAAG